MDIIYMLGWPLDDGQGDAGQGGSSPPQGGVVSFLYYHLFRKIVKR